MSCGSGFASLAREQLGEDGDDGGAGSLANKGEKVACGDHRPKRVAENAERLV